MTPGGEPHHLALRAKMQRDGSTKPRYRPHSVLGYQAPEAYRQAFE